MAFVMVKDFPFGAGGTRQWRLQEGSAGAVQAATASEGFGAQKALGCFGGRHALLNQDGSAAGPAGGESDFAYWILMLARTG
ncbi:hypothetical protein [Rhizobium sp. ICMP 5592]|uniref:hypothetical protein n=1 Tax=Rhizobium sp. ICMP 5592 TaxID=2292445 RepID=UPI0012980BCD|nr:hypothetical protein [Rhizobium sp. ICMP 5592]